MYKSADKDIWTGRVDKNGEGKSPALAPVYSHAG